MDCRPFPEFPKETLMPQYSYGSRSAPNTEQVNTHLNSKPSYPLKTGGASNGVGRLEKAGSK